MDDIARYLRTTWVKYGNVAAYFFHHTKGFESTSGLVNSNPLGRSSPSIYCFPATARYVSTSSLTRTLKSSLETRVGSLGILPPKPGREPPLKLRCSVVGVLNGDGRVDLPVESLEVNAIELCFSLYMFSHSSLWCFRKWLTRDCGESEEHNLTTVFPTFCPRHTFHIV